MKRPNLTLRILRGIRAALASALRLPRRHLTETHDRDPRAMALAMAVEDGLAWVEAEIARREKRLRLARRARARRLTDD